MRICSGQGCLRAVPDDVSYCDECKPTHSKAVDGIRVHQRTDAYNDELDALRKSGRWQKLRAIVVREQPLCARCARRPVDIVDHIVPAQVVVLQARACGRYPFDWWAGYFLRSNLQGLCYQCHSDKTREDKAHVGEWPDATAKGERKAKTWTF